MIPDISRTLTVVGVDVGGAKKGFHAVALRDGAYHAKFKARDALEIAAWCREVGARIIGIDAPCHWSLDGRARPCKRGLMKKKIFCFSSPTRDMALAHPRNNFGWMLAGEGLYQILRSTHALYNGSAPFGDSPLCFETFPQAVACALAGEVVSAKEKQRNRRDLLRCAGIALEELNSIDSVDAALCALTAHCLSIGHVMHYGDAETGLIVVPRKPLAKAIEASVRP